MIRWIAIVVLSIGLIGVGIWGYQENQEKNAVLIQAENNYQRSFHDLSYYMDLLHDKIGTTLAMNTKEQLSPQLIEIWRLTSQAQGDVGQLPLTLLPFNKTEEFLSNIGKFSYRTAVRDLENEPLSDEEVNTLKELYKKSGEIEKELRNVQNMVLKNNLRWMDVQLALASDDEPADNTIIDGFKTVEKTVGGYEEGDFGPTFTGMSKENHDYRNLQGDEISEDKARKQARKFFELDDQTEISLTKSGDGATVPFYSGSYQTNEKSGYVDISVKGGYPLSLMVNREVKEPTISLYEGMEKATKYLKGLDINNMVLFQSSQYDNVGVYSFLYKQDDIRVYPDSIQIKVALDNGEILGLSTREYLKNHQERNFEKPALTKEEARDKVNPNVKIQEESIAVIEDKLGEEVLAYEFLGTLGDDTYRIFINANTGVEVQVEKLKIGEDRFNNEM
ncbi:germination protein YpeB [Aquibacillus salsiterrae]|uniref:Germination protein YpeB n=1 Tax=Aquibacillus salsiterrae TaxID=2950439 RepID=A0A9X3WAB5_9BACI|nr:germination protein YpeB [Aquibacillus salsiterrae]MDC3415397.1 germination protein YpeB [Aquibacillus salsiterrae]